MSAVIIILFSAWAGVCTVWVGLLIAQLRLRRDGLILEPVSAEHLRMGESLPSVCVIIPARNEGAGLARCLESVLAQDYADLSVRVADDRSEDDTAAVAEKHARSDTRVQVTRIESLPPGWMGKSHALWTATRSVATDWLLFIDADCRLDPRAVSTVVQEAHRRNSDLLTLWPRQEAGSFWEHMTIPLCAGIIALWFGSRRVNDPDCEAAFANGQFLLIRRQAYESIGGHRSVRSALIEDVPLAECAKRAGVACRVASGNRLVAVRMYETYEAIRDGWARIYVGALRSGLKILVSIAWLLAGSLLPFVVASVLTPLAAWRWSHGGATGTATGAALVLSAFHLMLIAIVSYRFWGLGDCKRACLWLYPVSVVVVVRILFRAWWWLVVRRKVSWRHTGYDIDRRGAIVC